MVVSTSLLSCRIAAKVENISESQFLEEELTHFGHLLAGVLGNTTAVTAKMHTASIDEFLNERLSHGFLKPSTLSSFVSITCDGLEQIGRNDFDPKQNRGIVPYFASSIENVGSLISKDGGLSISLTKDFNAKKQRGPLYALVDDYQNVFSYVIKTFGLVFVAQISKYVTMYCDDLSGATGQAVFHNNNTPWIGKLFGKSIYDDIRGVIEYKMFAMIAEETADMSPAELDDYAALPIEWRMKMLGLSLPHEGNHDYINELLTLKPYAHTDYQDHDQDQDPNHEDTEQELTLT